MLQSPSQTKIFLFNHAVGYSGTKRQNQVFKILFTTIIISFIFSRITEYSFKATIFHSLIDFHPTAFENRNQEMSADDDSKTASFFSRRLWNSAVPSVRERKSLKMVKPSNQYSKRLAEKRCLECERLFFPRHSAQKFCKPNCCLLDNCPKDFPDHIYDSITSSNAQRPPSNITSAYLSQHKVITN